MERSRLKNKILRRLLSCYSSTQSACFLCSKQFDHKERTDHKGDAQRKHNVYVLHKACNNITYEGDCRDRNGVGQLCGNMAYMITLSACGGHNGSIGNW